ncbi:MAG TPA: glycosyltransferase family 4 protein [Acidimicrobiia bacterium]|nr:glycosyltransferase family 4 protein [Acidimicrobiia bacterium]
MVLRVVQVITDPTRRGAQLFALDLADALERSGHDVETVALGPAPGAPEFDVQVLGARRVGWSTVRALRAALAGADVAVAHGGQTLPACTLATLGTRTPFVYRQISDSRFWAPTAARRFRVRTGLARASIVVALWKGAALTLQQYFGVRADRVRVIPNGVVAERFAPVDAAGRARARANFGLDPGAFTLVYLGALVPEKGVDLAIEAVAHCAPVQLLVAGDGRERAVLEALAARVAPGRVVFAGRVEDVSSAYAAADAVVLASRGGDSMPAALIEAGLTELPAVATPIEAIPEIVVSGLTGTLVPVDDAGALARAFDALAHDRAGTAALGRAARAHCIAHFSIGPVAAAWGRVLGEVVDAPVRG